MKFESDKWKNDVPEFEFREAMFKHLDENRTLFNLSKNEAFDLLGEPKGSFYKDGLEVLTYPLIENYVNDSLSSYKYIAVKFKDTELVEYELIKYDEIKMFQRLLTRTK